MRTARADGGSCGSCGSSGRGFPLDFVVGACRDFDNDVDDAAVHVASVEDLVEVCHGFFLCCEGEGIITGFPRVRDAG